MRRNYSLFAIILLAVCLAPRGLAQGRITFRIKLGSSVGLKGASGRMLVFMSNAPNKPQVLDSGFIPGEVWIAAQEIDWIGSGQSVEMDPDIKAYPKPFSQAPHGTYHFMALLDRDHSYGYNGMGAGDIYGAVITMKDLDPARSGVVELNIDKVATPRFVPKDTEDAKLVEFRSPLLSAFWGRPIMMHAGVVLPPDGTPVGSFPTVYHVHGFGGDHSEAWFRGKQLREAMRAGKSPKMAHVFLDASFSTGHHVFADSVNNGPWGRALTTEMMPYMERRFNLTARPSARFLTGHSSGGWSTLWLQVAYPDFFGGTWSTSPDPVDLRQFTNIDVTPGSTDNFYHYKDGRPKNLVRMGGRDIATIEQFARQEEVVGEYGGQFASFEWVWSPKGPGGRPMQIANRVTGELNQEVARAWQKYDIRKVLETNWATLGPKLKGKLHIICGEEDTFHLEAGVKLLKQFLTRVHTDAVVELVPGRDHMNLYQPYKTYPKGLEERILGEMWGKFTAGVGR